MQRVAIARALSMNPAIILADSKDPDVSKKCMSIVEKAHYENWMDYANIKDILRYLKYKGFKPLWFGYWIESEGHVRTTKQYGEKS